MKLEVGMYVRYKNGNMARLVEIDDGLFYPKYYFDNVIGQVQVSQYYYLQDIYDCSCNDLEEHIRKDIEPSHNIIDLIEAGDYVNDYKVLEICEGNFDIKTPFNVKVLELEFIKQDTNPNVPFFKKYIFILNKEIKSIVTKEQFESVSYHLGKED